MDAILAAAITEIQSVVSQQFNNERHENELDLGGIDMTASIDMTTEPVQDPEVPDFVGGKSQINLSSISFDVQCMYAQHVCKMCISFDASLNLTFS